MFWLTEKLGRISQPNRWRDERLKDTQKHPSPSAYPERYAPKYGSSCCAGRRCRRVVALIDSSRSLETGDATARTRRSEQSLRGHKDFPRRYPGASASAGGFRRYEPVEAGTDRSVPGQVLAYPTRNFAELC